MKLLRWAYLATFVCGLAFLCSCSRTTSDEQETNVPAPATQEQAPAEPESEPAAHTDALAAPTSTEEAQPGEPDSVAAELSGPGETDTEAAPEGAEPADEASALLQAALQAAQRGDFSAAIEKVREAVAKKPDNPQLKLLLAQLIFVRARQLLAESDQDQAKLAQGAKLAAEATSLAREQLKNSNASDPLRLQKRDLLQSALVFNAVAQARQNKPDLAKELLREAVRSGLTDVEVLEQDEELAALKALPQFEELMAELREIAREQIGEQIDALMEATEPFAFDFDLKDIDGKPLRLSDFKGKVVLVDFWGTWCPPCRAAIPHLVKLYQEYHDKGFEIIGLAYEQAESEEANIKLVKEFAQKAGIPYRLALGDEKTQEQVPGFRGYPTVLLIDRSGKVRLVLVGYRPYEHYQVAVEKLLAEAASEGDSETTKEKGDETGASFHRPSVGRVRALAQVQNSAEGDDRALESDDKAAKLVERAQSLARQGKIAQAVKLAKQAHEAAPDNRQIATFYARGLFSYAGLLARQSKHSQAAKKYDEAATVIKKIAEDGSQLQPLERNILTFSLLSAAREYLQAKKQKVARERLIEALDRGFSQVEFLDSDPLLKELAQDKEVQEKIVAIREARARELRKQALAELAKGTSFPFDFELPDLSGKPVKLADFKGKVLIVDIWGTWCPPCRREVPHFIELHQKYRDKGLEIVGINFERVPQEQVVPTIQNFVAKMGITYTCVIGKREILQQVPGFRGYPTTLFLDRTGRVRAMVVGYRPIEFLEAIVQALLNEKPEEATSAPDA